MLFLFIKKFCLDYDEIEQLLNDMADAFPERETGIILEH